jgi:hypothetical protein
MKPSETVRFGCDECMVVFDLRLAPVSERLEHFEEDDSPMDVKIPAPFSCPFCQQNSLRVIHDRPFVAGSREN